MSASPHQLRTPLAYGHAPAYDSFLVVVGVLVAVVLALAAIPVAARGATLAVVLAVICALAAVQWLTHLRKFGFDPPVLPTLLAVLVMFAATPAWGETGALLTLCIGFAAVYAWRVAVGSGSRFADAAFGAMGIALFGFLPAQALLLRPLTTGYEGFALFLGGAALFTTCQGLLARPDRDGTRHADITTLAAAGTATFGVTVLGSVIGGAFIDWKSGFLVGVAVGGACALGQALLRNLLPSPRVDNRRVRRRPVLLDALAPYLFAAPAAYFVTRFLVAA